MFKYQNINCQLKAKANKRVKNVVEQRISHGWNWSVF